MRLIDADELEKWMNERMRSLRAAYGYHDAYTDGFEECMEAVENAETIVPDILRPTGRWVHNDEYVLWAENMFAPNAEGMRYLMVTIDTSFQTTAPTAGRRWRGDNG